VAHTFVVSGFDLIGGGNKPNAGTIFIPLKPWSERQSSADELAAKFMGAGMMLPDGLGLVFNPPPIMGLGTAGGFEVYVQNKVDGDPMKLNEVVQDFMAALQSHKEFSRINTFFRPTIPQLYVEVDEAKAISLGIPLASIYETLQSTMGSLYVNDFNKAGRVYRVQLQAEAAYRLKPEDMGKVYVRSSTSNAMIPLAAVSTVKHIVGPEQVERFNGFVAAKILGDSVPGVSSGDALRLVEEVAAQTLPAGYEIAWTGQAFQQKQTGSSSAQAFVFAIIMVFLILAAQFEKWSLPLAVIMAVPFALAGGADRRDPARHAQRHLLPDRPGGADRPGFQERHPDRRIRHPEAGAGHVPAGGGQGRRAIALPPHRHDLPGLHPGRGAPGGGHRRRCRRAAIHGHRRVRRHARRHLHRHHLRAPVLHVAVPGQVEPGSGRRVRRGGKTMSPFRIRQPEVLPLPQAGEGREFDKTDLVRMADPLIPTLLTPAGEGLKRALAVLFLPLALSGCSALGPDYARPALQPARRLHRGRRRARAGQGGGGMVETVQGPGPGQSGGPGPGPQLRPPGRRGTGGGGRGRSARKVAALLPSVDLDAGASRIRSSTRTAVYNTAMPAYRNSYSLGLSTAFELDFWGRLRRNQEAARALALASRHARDTVRLSLAGMVANTYLALRAYDAELTVARETLASREASLGIVTSRVEAGLASPIDQRQAEGALAASRAQVTSLRQLRAVTEHQLALLVGTPELRIAAGDLRHLPLPPTPPAGLPSSLLESRPDLRQAEEELVANNARIGVAKAALYPTISLTGGLGSESQDLSDLFSSGAGVWNLGLGLVLPMFDAGAGEARVDQATARQKQALAAYQKTVQTAFKEVNDALVGLREHAEGEAAQAARVAAEEQVLKLAEIRYQAGYSGYLEVLDAQRTLYDARLGHVATRQSRLAAAVDLFKALGGGWREGEVR
jgi:NodT family efflux transporter outer membrane factor (OMF) lipoprotein